MMRHGAGASEDLMDIDRLLQLAIDHGASDLHLSGGNPPLLRIDGEIRPLEPRRRWRARRSRGCCTAVLDEPQRAAYAAELEIDVAVAHASGTRFRLNGVHQSRRPGGGVPDHSVRRADARAARRALGPRAVAGLAKGLVLVTGPTGSGKSTTLAALIDHINRPTTAGHPDDRGSDRVRASVQALADQPARGRARHPLLRPGLRSALRADPDVILVGELRDYETIALALTAAETGHLVLATLHTTSAAKTIDRLIDVVPSADKPMVRTMLSSSLPGGDRADPAESAPTAAGRVAAYEVLIGTAAVANLIRENQIAQIDSMIQTGARFGMQLMTRCGPAPWRRRSASTRRKRSARCRRSATRRRRPSFRARARRAPRRAAAARRRSRPATVSEALG